jgi:hypothetical protein
MGSTITKTPLEVKETLGGEIAAGLGLDEAVANPWRKSTYVCVFGTGTTVTSATCIEGIDDYTITKTDAYVQIARTDGEVLENNVMVLNSPSGTASAANPGLTMQSLYSSTASVARLTNLVLTASEYETGDLLAGTFLLTIYEAPVA